MRRTIDIRVGDCRDVLRGLPSESVQCCVTSPPYYRLRDYGADAQIGLEQTPEEYVAQLVAVFREVRRVMRPDGTLWLNLGDSYAGRGGGCQGKNGQRADRRFTAHVPAQRGACLKPKDLIGIPWKVAFALRDDGWYLRADVIWSKPNPMPESIQDRPTRAHEYLFLLTKSARYFYDAAAIREPAVSRQGSGNGFVREARLTYQDRGSEDRWRVSQWRNRRTVWTIPSQPFHGAHFATFPPRLVEPCILAGSRPGDVVFDPFAGAGTTGLVAVLLGRDFVGIEINPTYAAMARERIRTAAPLLCRFPESAA